MLERADVREVTRRFILQEFLKGEDAGQLNDATPLITGGIMDSIATIRLVAHLEDQFGIEFDGKYVTVEHLDTIDRVCDTVEELRS